MRWKLTALVFATAACVTPVPPDPSARTVVATAENGLLDLQPIKRVHPSGFESCIRSRSGEERFELRLTVETDGSVSSGTFSSGSDPCFRPYVGRAVMAWRYRPVSIDGEPVRVEGVYSNVVISW